MVLTRYTAIAFMLFGLILPVRVPCGVPDQSCAPQEDAKGVWGTPYDIEPLSIMLLEKLLRLDLPLRYYRGMVPA